MKSILLLYTKTPWEFVPVPHLCTSKLDAIQEHQAFVLLDAEIAQGAVLGNKWKQIE